MPTRTRDDGAPIVTFDPLLEISPFTLFKRLQQGTATLLVDIRQQPGDRTLRGSITAPHPSWTPPRSDVDVVLFDEDGSAAFATAHRLREAGFSRVKALFGGLDLYQFALDPEILQSDTFLESEV